MAAPRLRPNPSLESGLSTAGRLGLEAPKVYLAPRGPGVLPRPADQLKRLASQHAFGETESQFWLTKTTLDFCTFDGMRTLLHVGCGRKRKDRTTAGFNTSLWTEIRLDIDPEVNPDVVGTLQKMPAVGTSSIDAIFSSHNIEHLYPHEVPSALLEFLRVLKPEGFLVLTCPDLQSICALVSEDKLTEPVYTAPAGPIAPIDILYGHRASLAGGNLFMAHRCGFTRSLLVNSLRQAGFESIISTRRTHPFYDLWALASVSAKSETDLRALANEHFPMHHNR